MPRTLPRGRPLTELHCHLGGAVAPAIMWGIAHAQGIRLPTKDYWQFRELITVSRRHGHSFDGYLELFHWTELIQSSPIAVERSVYEVIGGAYRKNNITTTELRFNPMKRNRGGEQDLDHIISAAIRAGLPSDVHSITRPRVCTHMDPPVFVRMRHSTPKAPCWRSICSLICCSMLSRSSGTICSAHTLPAARSSPGS